MPDEKSKKLSRFMRFFKPFYSRVPIKIKRNLQDTFGNKRFKRIKKTLEIEKISANGVEAVLISPKVIKNDSNINKIGLYIHGGAYVIGGYNYVRNIGGYFSHRFNTKMLGLNYRLAPENPYPAALVDAVNGYKYLLENGYHPKNIYLFGESAGGGLLFSLCLKLKELKLPLPSLIIAISPWVDLTLSGSSYIENQNVDPTLSYFGLNRGANLYAEGNKNSELVSPIFGDLEGMPESIIFASTNELLIDDARGISDALKKQGNMASLYEFEEMWHVFPLFDVPEAKQAHKIIEEHINTMGRNE